MTDEQESPWGAESPDAELIAAVRLGDNDAFGILYRRHASAARTVAGQYLRSASEADDAVADAFTKVLAILSTGGGPDIAFRAYLFTVVRRLAFEIVNGARRTQPTDDMAAFESAFGPLASSEDPALQGFERTTVAQAFRSLPERWQSVLWYSEVEGLAPAAIAPILGLTPNSAAALAYRAREGLREAYLQQHLSSVPADECQRANALLGSFVRGGLAKRETAVVEHHLEDCGECRALVLELGDVAHGMRAVIAPLVLGIAGLGLVGTALPTWGAAGTTTALTATASAAVGATGATSAGTGGSGTASGSSTAGGSGTAGGSAAAGGAATTGAATAGAGGLAALVAAAPALVLGLAAVIVVATGVGVAALLGVIGGDDADPLADPAPAASSTSPLDSPGGQGTDGAGGLDSADPSTSPSDAASVPALPQGLDDATDAPDRDRARTPSAPSSAAPGTPALPAPSTPAGPDATAPGPDAAAPGPVVPDPTTPDPTAPATPPDTAPGTPDVSVGLVSDGKLVAGQNNTLELALNNSGASAINDVGLELTLPAGLRFVPDGASDGGAFGPRFAVATSDGWTCLSTGEAGAAGATSVRCDRVEISPGADSPLTLGIYAERSGVPLTITAQLYVGTTAVGELMQLTHSVAQEPARLAVTAQSVAALVAGRPGNLAVTAANLGQATATGVQVDVPLPETSGLTWRRSAGAALVVSGGSDAGWTCAAGADASGADVASCTRTGGIDGDSTSMLVLPVTVAAAPAPAVQVVPTVAHDGVAPITSASVDLAVNNRGLSAGVVLDGPLRTAQIAGGLREAVVLTPPAGGTVLHAEVVWSGADAGGVNAAGLAALELRTDAKPGGASAQLPLAGTPVVVDAANGYWGAADVTTFVASTSQQGRWTVVPKGDAAIPADLRWTLTVVYLVPGSVPVSVTVLSGPPTMTSAAGLALPAPSGVAVSASASVRGGVTPDLTVNGMVVAATGPVAGALAYRTGTVVAPAPGAPTGLALTVTPPTGMVDTIVVHSSPDVSAAGPLDQTQPPVVAPQPQLVVDPLWSLAGLWLWPGPLKVHNPAPTPVTATIVFNVPASLVFSPKAGGQSDCLIEKQTVTCPVLALKPGGKSSLGASVRGWADAVKSGELRYTVTTTEPLTGMPTVTRGVVGLTVG